MSTQELAIKKPTKIAYFTPTADEVAIIKNQVAPTLTPEEFALFMNVSIARGLNPLLNQIYAIKRETSRKLPNGQWVKEWKMTIQTAIEGFIIIANRTGELEGHKTWTTGSLKTGDLQAHAIVYRKGWKPTEISIYWDEFGQVDKDGNPVAMWKKMPRWMLEKVALARALSRTFPEDLGGLYTNDEMPAVDVTPVDVLPATPPVQSLTNGGTHPIVNEAIIAQKAEEERNQELPEPLANPWLWELEGTERMDESLRGAYLCDLARANLKKLASPAYRNCLTPADFANLKAASGCPELQHVAKDELAVATAAAQKANFDNDEIPEDRWEAERKAKEAA